MIFEALFIPIIGGLLLTLKTGIADTVVDGMLKVLYAMPIGTIIMSFIGNIYISFKSED